jgi:hypothetical protein
LAFVGTFDAMLEDWSWLRMYYEGSFPHEGEHKVRPYEMVWVFCEISTFVQRFLLENTV